jgi:hypothetical protein
MPILAWGKLTGADILLPWRGHCILDGCRLRTAGDQEDVLLDWCELPVDEHTVALWHLNEPQWTGLPGEVEDSSGRGHHGTAYNGATTTAGWLDRCGWFDQSASPYKYLQVPDAPDLHILDNLTVECWVRWAGPPPTFGWPALVSRKPPPPDERCNYYFGTWERTPELYFTYNDGSWRDVRSGLVLPERQWAYVAVSVGGSSVRFWLATAEGTQTALRTRDTSNPLPDVPGPVSMMWSYNRDQYFYGHLDEVRISNVARYIAASPAPTAQRYETGAVIAQYALGSPYLLTGLDWAGTFGPDCGRVRRVYVYVAGEEKWEAVGPEYPKPPLTGLGLQVTGPNLVKVELEPRQDYLQSETPVLDWLAVELVAVQAGAGRKLIAAALPRARLELASGTTIAATLPRHKILAETE